MARKIPDRNIDLTLSAAEQWIKCCLIEDGSLFGPEPLWTAPLIDEVHQAVVGNPDEGTDDFLTKLKGQLLPGSLQAHHLVSEMLWALLLFPSNIRPKTKRRQICETWCLSGPQLSESIPLLHDDVMQGVGSGGPGFNNYRYRELAFLIEIARDLKGRDRQARHTILSEYDAFIEWIGNVPQLGRRQFRHMLRYFAFPDRVERISSDRDRRSILVAYKCALRNESSNWSDSQLDDALLSLRQKLESENQTEMIDFYMPRFKAVWAPERTIKTIEGEIAVTVPQDDDEDGDDADPIITEVPPPQARQSLQIQAKIAEIGATMGFRIWIPRADRERIRGLIDETAQAKLLDDLPLNYDKATLDTIEQIDVLWLNGRAMARAFEVEHTTAVYSGLLRMADLLALQPNMDIRLHIVAPDDRREKVFHEMLRPVFALLDRGPLVRSCTFLSYESIIEMRALEHLAHTSDSIIEAYEEPAQP